MNVVVDMLSSNDGSYGMSMFRFAFGAGVSELCSLLLETGLDGAGITMVVLTVLDGQDVVLVLFGEHLTILDWLD